MTAEEIWLKEYEKAPSSMNFHDYKQIAKNAMIKFAKFHVEAALKAASRLDFENVVHPEANDYKEAVEMTILECYSLDNIK